MVGAGFVWAGWFGRYCQVIEEACQFLCYGGVALDWRVFAALAAMEYRDSARRLYKIAVLQALVCPSAQNGCFGRNAIVAASRVFAEVDLDAVGFVGYSACAGCGRICVRNGNLLSLVLERIVRYSISKSTHLCGTASLFLGYFLFGEAKESDY